MIMLLNTADLFSVAPLSVDGSRKQVIVKDPCGAGSLLMSTKQDWIAQRSMDRQPPLTGACKATTGFGISFSMHQPPNNVPLHLIQDIGSRRGNKKSSSLCRQCYLRYGVLGVGKILALP